MIKLRIHGTDYRKIFIPDLHRAINDAGISKRKLCVLMGWSRSTFRRYEKKTYLEIHITETLRLLDILEVDKL